MVGGQLKGLDFSLHHSTRPNRYSHWLGKLWFIIQSQLVKRSCVQLLWCAFHFSTIAYYIMYKKSAAEED
ncbi:hypothetical protein ABKV19_014480 [Rosa sericea]